MHQSAEERRLVRPVLGPARRHVRLLVPAEHRPDRPEEGGLAQGRRRARYRLCSDRWQGRRHAKLYRGYRYALFLLGRFKYLILAAAVFVVATAVLYCHPDQAKPETTRSWPRWRSACSS